MIETLCRVFKRPHYPAEITLVGVRWYSAHPLSRRHLKEMMAECGVVRDHSAIHRWAIKMLPVLVVVCRQRRRAVSGSRRMDGTCGKVCSQ